MASRTDGADDIRQLLIQRLESLQRSGLTVLPQRKLVAEQQGKPISKRHAAASPAVVPPSLDIRTPSAAKLVSPSIAVPNKRIDTPTAAPAKRSDDDRRKALAAMQLEVAACRRCEHLACTRTQTVFGVGNERPRLVFMGEAPGADEDRRGEPFVGRAGQLLTDIIEKGMQLKRSDVYILNVLKCRPPDNRTPTESEIANCREYFERQLQLLQPEFICLLGATAVRAVLNTKQSMGRLRGQWFEYGDSRVMVTYHPSYLLRNPPAKKETWEDIQMLMLEMGLAGEK